jgi:mannitol-1-phosphate 5-dehydrogenase
MKLVQFGAGNIGRSFIGQIFSKAGWEVVFVDIDPAIIEALNGKRRYTVVVKDRVEETIVVQNVRGVLASDPEAVSAQIAGADLLATAVGQGALPRVIKAIAAGILERRRLSPGRPLDIVICENMRGAASYFRRALAAELPRGFPLDEYAGLVETSIGKMVPIMGEEERRRDPLLVYAEAYNTLLLDRKGFKGPVPRVPNLDPKENMKAYVDRKLYIHNLGHAVLAYVSFAFRPAYRFVWEAAADRDLQAVTRAAMGESGRALVAEYPEEFDGRAMSAHIDDLIARFGNQALGDTIYRAGRDLARKLAPDDRLIGAVRLCLAHRVEPKAVALGVASAFFFRGVDEKGMMFESDRLFQEREASKGFDHVMKSVCGLQNPSALAVIGEHFAKLLAGERDLTMYRNGW